MAWKIELISGTEQKMQCNVNFFLYYIFYIIKNVISRKWTKNSDCFAYTSWFTSFTRYTSLDKCKWYKYFSYPGYNYKGNDIFPENIVSQVSTVITPNINAKYFGGVLAPNGKIYMIPYSASNVLILDPKTNTFDTTTISNLGSGQYKWQGGVLASNGKIYGIPRNSTSVLIIDPVTNTADTTTISDLSSQTNKWAGGVLAPNGNIYCIPRNAADVLVINPLTNTKSFITGAGAIVPKWEGGVLGVNGNVYGVPYNINQILQINTNSNTLSFIDISATVPSPNENWNGGALASNGRIYMSPLQDSRVLVLDTSNNGVSVISGAGAGGYKYVGATLAPNGKIYCIPHLSTNCLIIDPIANTLNNTSITGLPGNYAWQGGVLALMEKFIAFLMM